MTAHANLNCELFEHYRKKEEKKLAKRDQIQQAQNKSE